MMDSTTQHGLRANAFQFWMLVLVNAFVGGMVGLERAILPQIAEVEFGMESKTAILSFIVAFGLTKAITNYLMGRLANKVGRRKLLILGWLFAIPVPFPIDVCARLEHHYFGQYISRYKSRFGMVVYCGNED